MNAQTISEQRLREIYRDPLGGGQVAPMDIHIRRTAFERDLSARISDLRKAAGALDQLIGHAALEDPYIRRWATVLLDARTQATRAVDGLLSDMDVER